MITVCILTKDSQQELIHLLPTLQFANEIVIIDDFSIDNTKNIAIARKCRFFQRHLNNDFAAQRNFALTKAKNEWVLFIDPDETTSKDLIKEIENTIKNTQFDGFLIKRTDILFGRTLRYGETSHTKLVRLGRKNAGKWVRAVHETWDIQFLGHLKHSISHSAHPSISSFLSKINYYTSIEASLRHQQNQSTNLAEIIFYPLAKFIQNYLIRRGILDGFEGFIMAFMMSTHSFFVRAKLYAKQS